MYCVRLAVTLHTNRENVVMYGKYFEIKKLIEAVEGTFGKSVKVGSDFEKLASAVWSKCEEHLSPNALKHLWNFFSNMDKPKRDTLDTLSMFVGFQNWEGFKSALHGESDGETNYAAGRFVCDKDIIKNDKVTIIWHPMNKCVVKYLGENNFRVISSDSPMLSVNDTFECDSFVTGEALLARNLIHDNSNPSDFVIGGKYGITVSL